MLSISNLIVGHESGTLLAFLASKEDFLLMAFSAKIRQLIVSELFGIIS
jgi:hypothetical protein